jgi:hypothetical protein
MIFDYAELSNASKEKLVEIYSNLHEFRKNNPLTEFEPFSTARHHFKPRSHGGADDSENYIRITNEEHFVAHYILHKIYGGKMTSSLAILCGGLFNNSRCITKNLEEISKTYSSEIVDVRKSLSERMMGEKNPAYGKYGKNHPTTNVDRSGENNPNFGKITSEKCKKATSASNSGKIVAKDTRTGEIIRVTKEEFDSCEFLVGSTSGEKNENIKGTVSVLDLTTGEYMRVSRETYDAQRDRYAVPSSKIAKEFKEKNNVSNR